MATPHGIPNAVHNVPATDPALRLAAALSYLAVSEEGRTRQRQAIDAAQAAGLDPKAILRLIERHRIPSLALAVLTACDRMELLGEDGLAELRRRDADSRRTSLLLALRGGQALRMLREAGIPCLELKGGPTLSRKLYGDLALRHCKDMDLVVPGERLPEALFILKTAGWKTQFHPVWTTPGYRTIGRYALRDVPVLDSSGESQIELHTRFEYIVDPHLEPIWWEAMRSVDDKELAPVEFLYLIAHGTKHLWERMKWLGDIAAALERHPNLIRDAHPLAQELRLERCLPVLSALMESLYQTRHPDIPGTKEQARRLAEPCLQALRTKDALEMTALEEAAHRQRHVQFRLAVLGGRTSLSRRAAFLLFGLLVRPKDLEDFYPRHRLWLPALPFLRLGSAVWRYTGHLLHPVPGGAHRK